MNMKIKWLREKLNGLNLDGMIISNPVNIRYLTGINAEGTLVITRKENVYITDGRYIEIAQTAVTIDDEILILDSRTMTSGDYENYFIFCENVGFEEKYVTYENYKKLMHMYKINNLVETEGILENQRMIKDEEEISKIKKACEITDNCFEYLQKTIKKGMTEKEIAFMIQKYFLLNRAEKLAFDSIVASGENSSLPHAEPTDRKIESGDIITIDFGCVYEGYHSDMTRTIFVDYVKDIYKPVYDLVLKNQMQTMKELKDGVAIKMFSKLVENDFKLKGYDMIHGLGHGVGLNIHELPVLNTKSEFMLKENMVVTNEPGIYIPGDFGVRIEDTVQIAKYSSIQLTNSGKNYIII